MGTRVGSWRLVAVAGTAAGLIGIFLLAQGSSDETETHVPDQVNGAPRLVAVDARGAIVQSPNRTWGVQRRDGDGDVAWSLAGDVFFPVLASCPSACPSAVLTADTNGLSSHLAQDPAPMVKGATIPKVLSKETGGKLMLFGVTRDAGLRYSTDSEGSANWGSLRDGRLRQYPAAVGYVDWFPASDGSAGVAAVDGSDGRDQQLWVNDHGWIPVGRPIRTESGFGCASSLGRYALLDGTNLVRRGQASVRLSKKPPWSNCAFTNNRVIVAAYRMTNGAPSTTISIFDLNGRLIRSAEFDVEYFLVADAGGATFALVGASEAQVRNQDGRLVDTFPDVKDARYDGLGELVLVNGDGEVRWVHSRRP